MTTSDDNDFTFIYDTTAGIPAVLMEYVYNTIPRLYVRTPDGRLIAACHISSGAAYLDSYYHFDGLGNTKALTNSEGGVTDRYTYDVWGNVTRTYGETQQPYMFVGQLGYYTHHSYYDKLNPFSNDSDKYVLLQLGVRYYQPGMGRFTQRDRILSVNETTYLYAIALPTAKTDAWGLYAGGRGCAGTHMDDWIRAINEAIQKAPCRQAMQNANVLDCIVENLRGLTINCGRAPGGNRGYTNTCPPYDITIDTAAPGNGPRGVLHEAVHACRLLRGLWAPDRQPGYWTCSSCGTSWGDRERRQPYPFIREEKIAEGVVHKCGF